MTKTVLITGATGFLGAHIVRSYSNSNYKIICTRRNQSDLWRCADIPNISWINIEQDNWKAKVVDEQPDIIIHSAWEGVISDSRDNWKGQVNNLGFLFDLLLIAKEICCKKFIGIGSQAEYGLLEERVNEQVEAKPHTAYGLAKFLAMQSTKTFCNIHSINWYWIRVFSVFGEYDNNNWLIPSLIKKLLNNQNMDLTGGEQKYDYVYARDLAKMILLLSQSAADNGIYNLSSNSSISLKSLILEIREIICSKSVLNFGAVPYRAGQSMLMEGDCHKYFQQVTNFEYSPLNTGLQKTIDFYKELIKQANESI